MSESIAVVVLDAVRADAFRREFDWLPGRRYEQVYSTSHWTIPAHASLLTGLVPRETGTYAGAPEFSPSVVSLPEQLREAGYTTRLYTANVQLVQWDGWTDGFDDVEGPDLEAELFDWTGAAADATLPGPLRYPEVVARCLASDADILPSLRDGWRIFRGGEDGLTAEDIFEAFLDREGDRSREFVLFNLMDVHSSAGRSTGEAIAGGVPDPEALADAYGTALEGLSADYRPLFEHLQEEFDLVITLSDHGELLGEHGLSGHGYGIYPELVRVPLVVSGGETDYPTDGLVSLLEVPATVRDVAGVDRVGRGRTLFGESVRERAPVERLGQPHLHEKMFERHGILDEFDRYDRALRGVAVDGAYAYETESGVTSTGTWEGDASGAIAAWFDDVDVHTTDDDPEVSAAVEERLRDLGYA
jgi:arylsulfatase